MDPKWFESIDHGIASVSWVHRDGKSETNSTGPIPQELDEAIEDTRWIERPLVRINHDLIHEIRVAREKGF